MAVTDLARVRFSVHENLVRLGKAMADLRRDTGCFGHGVLVELLPQGIGDTDWIPIVGDRGWVVITNDKRIRTRPAEAELAIAHRLRVVHLHGAVGSGAPWAQLVRLASRWDALEKALSHADGPVWLSVQASALRVLSFAPGSPERS